MLHNPKYIFLAHLMSSRPSSAVPNSASLSEDQSSDRSKFPKADDLIDERVVSPLPPEGLLRISKDA
ncbi:CMF_collapsed_G0013320.mRNA.1.CDS.1 [Saccharomyces cerevisiae]|nr:CMF_collapsed_G0013320.mRNA.1.CDS.1 [Saccharomyces cerevisiae]